MSDCTTVQANVVPETLLVKAIDGDVPEQIVFDAGLGSTFGIGLIVIITVLVEPAHPAAVGVTA
jgi:hypothetical protein